MDVETLQDSTIATRIIVALQARALSLQSRLPPPWRVSPVAAGASEGANLYVLFNDALLNQDAEGKAAPDAVSRYVGLVIPAVHAESGETASVNFRILTAHPQGVPGKYRTSLPASVWREQRIEGQDLEATVTDRFEVRSTDGGSLDLRLRYRRGIPSRVTSQSSVRSAFDPTILRLYHTDQLADIVKSIPAGIDRVASYKLSVTVPDLATLFDGNARLVSITVNPWYVRRVFGRNA